MCSRVNYSFNMISTNHTNIISVVPDKAIPWRWWQKLLRQPNKWFTNKLTFNLKKNNYIFLYKQHKIKFKLLWSPVSQTYIISYFAKFILNLTLRLACVRLPECRSIPSNCFLLSRGFCIYFTFYPSHANLKQFISLQVYVSDASLNETVQKLNLIGNEKHVLNCKLPKN